MGSKSRSNYALGLSLSQEEYDRIFNKDRLDKDDESITDQYPEDDIECGHYQDY